MRAIGFAAWESAGDWAAEGVEPRIGGGFGWKGGRNSQDFALPVWVQIADFGVKRAPM
jgi:hypothetical protein